MQPYLPVPMSLRTGWSLARFVVIAGVSLAAAAAGAVAILWVLSYMHWTQLL